MAVLREERLRQGQTGALVGIMGNLLLGAAKVAAGSLASSHAMLADGLHSLADFASSIALLVVVRVANRPSDTCHPYGHGKAEPVGAKIIGIIVVLAGFQIGLSAIGQLRAGNYAAPGVLALWMALISIVVKETMFRYKFRLATRANSKAILASAWEHRSDAVSSVAVLAGVGLARLGMPYLDPVAGLLVSGFIVKMGWDITRSAVDDLMDKVTDLPLLDRVCRAASETAGVIRVDAARIRPMGPDFLVDLAICVDPQITVKEGHDVASSVKSAVMIAIPEVAGVMVHVNPCR
jgi:cation diffusion facilitator family transporter